ncbi:hypothetical protein IQ247_09745 [Plectonema cf. radiosum LEGE 06105]|uniref:Uncharacterized protein n=1 Tax=Plectonema cf. radiosum LEGE 06105 TaxID=945769 RepID=A0A8J7F6Q6_9CYAN|nr:hypothetical protein [Plectonema radiosum]MBE9212964.1 hypothetical protein [Plectonema cf. radiosum LEGE 06105]
MQRIQLIREITEKLRSGESKKYSELRNAIAAYELLSEVDAAQFQNSDLRTPQGKQQLLALAEKLIADYDADNGESIESAIDERLEDFDRTWETLKPAKLKRFSTHNAFWAAMFALYKDNNQLLTADGLIRLGDEADAMIDGEELKGDRVYNSLTWDTLADLANAKDRGAFRRICVDPGEMIEDPEIEAPTDNPFIKEMQKVFTKERVVRGLLTRQVYDNLRFVQDHFFISGLREETFTCRGLNINCLTETFLLNLIPSDERKLWRQVNKITDRFLQLAVMDNPKYKLSRVDFSDYEEWGDRGEDIPTTYSQVWEYAQAAVSAWVTHESTEWKERTQKIISSTRGEMEARIGKGIDKPDEPDRIELHLTMGWENFEKGNASDCVTFRLSHPYRD